MKEFKPQIPRPEIKPQFAQIDRVWTEGFENIQRIKAKSGNLVLGTEVGGRTRNEDRAFLNTELDFFGVVDGIGGHPKGDIAAQLVAENLLNAIKQGFLPDQIAGKPEFFLRRHPEIEYNSGACYLAAKIEKKILRTWCAGDCSLLVVDDKGKIKFETESTDLNRAAIGLQAAAGNPEYTGFLNLMNYDRIYAFTDGLSDNVNIEQAVLELKGLKVENAIKQLAATAKEAMVPVPGKEYMGNKDNITILIYEILPVPLRGK